MSFMTKLAALAAAPAVLAACAAGPDYVRPAVEVPGAYKEAGGWKVARPSDHLPRGKWWEIFEDARLNALEEQVQISDQNVLAAEAQYRQAQALVREAWAGYFPTLTGNAAVTRSQSTLGGGAVPSAAGGPVFTTHSASLSASWEVDLWGRVRRQVEASAQASVADLESVRLSAQATLAQDYFLLRVADAQKDLLERSVAAYQRALQITVNQYRAGVAPRVDVVQAQAQLKGTQAQLIDVGVQRAQLEHAIAVLIGKPPSTFSIESGALATTLPAIPVGVPSALLERRPDVASAERQVAAANAQIGAAKAAYFPTLSLSASGGYQSASLASLLKAANQFWAIGPSIAETLFDAGLRRAHTAQAVAAYDAAVATYRQTVLGGFQEVEDNLAALRILEQEAQVQEEAVQAARRAVVLTTNQYKAGTVSYLNVVVVQTTALTDEITAVQLIGRRLTASVLLIKALGGGWSLAETSAAR
jgi:NodT family efflux transporter outer membrane factor (OMF) lipoprotein